MTWAFSSVGRAAALQAAGRRFEPVNAHHIPVVTVKVISKKTIHTSVMIEHQNRAH